MTVEQPRDAAQREPFEPFDLSLADGPSIPVPHREFRPAAGWSDQADREAVGVKLDRASLDPDGFERCRAVLTDRSLERAREATRHPRDSATPDRRGGVRRPFDRIDGLEAAVASSGVPGLIRSLLGDDAFVCRAILFDKTPDANWAVGWHRDTAIAVAERVDVEGFGPWSEKDGVPHVRPPDEVLDAMVTIRLHLDDCGSDNGALRVVPGSHLTGDPEARPDPVITCEAAAGDALVMRPRLLHSSSKSATPTRRRVLHMECAAFGLPRPLRWFERRALRLPRASPVPSA